VEFRLLGPIEVRDNGEALALGGAKQRSLLAILLLNANEVVSSDRLIDELWGAEAPETAAKALQVHVSQLRKVLEPDRRSGESARVLVTRSPGYLIQVDPEQLDLGRFHRLAAAGRDALAAGDHETAARALREALELWRGPPLAELAYADSARREISRLEELRLGVLEDRIQADLDCGRHAEVIGELETLVAEEPLRERPRAQLMLALYRAGRQAEALDAYRDARRALVEELGIEPSRELRGLEAAILEQDPALDLPPTAPEPPPPAAAAGEEQAGAARSDSFVGRQRELGEFRAALDGAFAGRMSLLLIAGEPGIGKSRLADEWTSLGEARGAEVLWGRCWEAGGAPAYWPWVQALRTYIRDGDENRIRGELEPYAADIAQMLPELNELFPDLPPAPSIDPEGARFRLFDSTASFLRKVATTQPIVLVVDDLHAADKPSLLLLEFLARSLREARLVVVGAYRDTEPRSEDLTEAVAEVRREPVTRAVRLGGLDVSEVARVIELTARTHPTEELAAAIHRETEGNPLFVGELVRLLASEDRLEEAARATGALSIPQGVREVIDHRLRRLSRDCKEVLSVASVLGREFRLDALGRVSERGDEELLDLLDEAQAARVVVDLPAGRGGLRFSHALIRDSLYGDLGTREHLELHQRAAEALEALYAANREPHLAELAHHFLEGALGGDVDKAIEYARRAGNRAVALLAFEEAARLYQMALEAIQLKEPAHEATRCELLLALGEAQARGGDMPLAKDTFVLAADIARKLKTPKQLARAAVGYGGRYVWFRAGKDQRLIPLLQDGLEALPDASPERARLLARLAGALRDHPVPDRRASLSRDAVEIARKLGDPATLAYAIEGTYAAISWPRETDAWLAMAQTLIELADETRDKEHAFSGHLHAFGAFMVRGDLQAAEAEFAAAARLAQDLRQPAQLWGITVVQTMRAFLSGRFEDVRRLMERTVELGAGEHGALGMLGDTTFYYVKHFNDWALARETGGLEGACEPIEGFVAEYPTFFMFHCLLASVYSDLRNETGARQQLDWVAAGNYPGLEVGTEWFFGASLLAEVCAFLGATAHAERLYQTLLPYRDCNVYSHLELSLGSASRYLGILATTTSRQEEAAAHFERALEMNARMGARPWVAHTQHDYARMLLARSQSGDRARARDLLATALETYRELGMEPWAERAESELAEV
jgi:DNA-binding SARP family transcriptional activator